MKFNKSLRKWKCAFDMREVKEAAKRCWKGYEPVPGKKPYSEDSCRPISAGKNKIKKKASTDQSTSLNTLLAAYKLLGL